MSDEQRTEPERKMNPKQTVYFIQSQRTGLIKIGTSYSTPQRVRDLSIEYQSDMEVLGIIPGAYLTEKIIHQHFAHLNAYGEWFRAGPDLLEYITNETLPPSFEIAKRDWNGPSVVRAIVPRPGLKAYHPSIDIAAMIEKIIAYYSCDRDWLLDALVTDAFEDVSYKIATGDEWARR